LLLCQLAAREIFRVATFTRYSSSVFCGFRLNPEAESSFVWATPAVGAEAGFNGPDGEIGLVSRSFASLAEYSRATGQDSNSVLVDYDVFRNVPALDARDPATLQRLYQAEDYDFRLRAGSVAIDAGVAIPNVTDGHAGRAPDLGAVESGAEPAHYGPRP
jgi:hypothetical protein